MAEFITYEDVVSKKVNDQVFIDNHINRIFALHKRQHEEELVQGYSNKQYEIFLYHIAYDYCLNLFFLVLEKLSNSSISTSEKLIKMIYHFDTIQTNLAHVGIDLDKIYEDIKINYTPVAYEN